MKLIYQFRYILFLFFITPTLLGAPREYLFTFLLLGLAILLTKAYEFIKKKQK